MQAELHTVAGNHRAGFAVYNLVAQQKVKVILMCNRLLLFIAAVVLTLAASCGYDGSYSVLISESGSNSTIRTVRFNVAGQRDPLLRHPLTC